MDKFLRYGVLGAGMQGAAAAFDLIVHGEAAEVVLLDRDLSVAEGAARRINALIGAGTARGLAADASRPESLRAAFSGLHGVLSAVPYGFNPAAAAAAISAGACFNDLGGNTAVVRQELELDALARAAGVSVVPDCGLAPGLGNILAAWLVSRFDQPESVHIRCGGLPQRPHPPLGYQLVFNIAGLTNEYSGQAEFLRDGRLVQVPALTETEVLHFPPPLGTVEACVTSGGTSTAPASFLHRLLQYDYKTIRYPGHFAQIRTAAELGFLDTRPVLVGGQTIVPREVFHALVGPKLVFPGERDLVVMRVTCSGTHQGVPLTRRVDLLDFHDERTGFTAMERTTAFPAAAVLHLQVTRRVPPGAIPPEKAVATDEYVDAVRRRGIALHESVV